MLEYNRNNLAEGIDGNKTSSSQEYYCYYWYFVKMSFKFQLEV